MKMCLDNPTPASQLFEMSFQILPNACCRIPRLFHRDGQTDTKATLGLCRQTQWGRNPGLSLAVDLLASP